MSRSVKPKGLELNKPIHRQKRQSYTRLPVMWTVLKDLHLQSLPSFLPTSFPKHLPVSQLFGA